MTAGWLFSLSSLLILEVSCTGQAVISEFNVVADSLDLREGRGLVSKNVEAAIEQLEAISSTTTNTTAAAFAFEQLAQIFERGELTERGRDLDRAFGYYKNAAELGLASAQSVLSFAYATGSFNVEKDEASSILNAYFAGLDGDALAAMTLGYRHLHGLGVPKRFVRIVVLVIGFSCR
jgi:TPR repeat protein